MTLLLFPDVELWATGHLRTALAARAEAYASNVKVSNRVPDVMPGRLVTVRRDGGPRLDQIREAARLGVNVWAATEQDVADLAQLVRALLWAAPDGQPVCKVSEPSGPSPIADESGKPHKYFTAELIVRASDLA